MSSLTIYIVNRKVRVCANTGTVRTVSSAAAQTQLGVRIEWTTAIATVPVCRRDVRETAAAAAPVRAT